MDTTAPTDDVRPAVRNAAGAQDRSSVKGAGKRSKPISFFWIVPAKPGMTIKDCPWHKVNANAKKRNSIVTKDGRTFMDCFNCPGSFLVPLGDKEIHGKTVKVYRCSRGYFDEG